MRRPDWPAVAVAVVIAATVAVMGYAWWWTSKHPCLETAPSTCHATYCVGYMYLNKGMICTMWHHEQYPCRVCVKREGIDE